MYVGFPQRVLRVLCGYFTKQAKRDVREKRVRPCDYPHEDLARIKMVGALGKECKLGCY